LKNKLLSIIKSFLGFLILIILIFLLVNIAFTHSFNENTFDYNNIYNNIKELSSPTYKGRLAGTEGNIKALRYIENYFNNIGIKPAGSNGTYYQPFTTMVPQYNSEPLFDIEDSNGNIVKKFVFTDDFRESLSGFGGIGEVSGPLLSIENTIGYTDSKEIKGKVLVSPNIPQDEDIEFAIKSGAKAILIPSQNGLTKNIYPMTGRTGTSIPILKITTGSYNLLKEYCENNYKAHIRIDVTYKPLTTSNLLGKIDGSKKNSGYIIIAANIDSLGEESNGKYFPGALDNASGISFMMELARDIKLQKKPPEKTIIFAAWNSSKFGFLGSSYYVNNPIYPLSKTEVINLDSLGCIYPKDEYTSVCLESASEAGNAIVRKLNTYGTDNKITTQMLTTIPSTDVSPFMKAGVTAVNIEETDISSSATDSGKYTDTVENIPKINIKFIGPLFMNYIKHEVYKDNLSGLFSGAAGFVMMMLAFGLLFIYLIEIIYSTFPALSMKFIKIEDIYYSTLYNLFVKIYNIFTPIVIILFILVFIINIPRDFNIIHINGEISSNTSFYIILKNTLKYIAGLFTHGLGTSLNHFSVIRIISASFMRSFILLMTCIIFSFILGTLLGSISGFKGNGSSHGNLGTLVLLSLPDVFIVLMMELLLIYLNKHGIFASFISSGNKSLFLVSFICLSIFPTVYISRIASVAVKEERAKEYVKAARAKGLSDREILIKHILISAVIKVVDSLQSVLAIIISNLIIVECLLFYPGIAYSMLSYYKDGDTNTIIGLILSMGVMYVIFMLIFKLMAKLVNPLRRGVSK
jgi:ABC-type dipeptide/oligopeptide/nickel transport system permease component